MINKTPPGVGRGVFEEPVTAGSHSERAAVSVPPITNATNIAPSAAGGMSLTHGMAVDYVQRGWAVVPLHWITDGGRCSCSTGPNPCGDDEEGYKSAGKHPLRKAWSTGAALSTADLYAIWAEETPQANIGIRTGVISGFFVLDVDPKSDGFRSLQNLQNEIGVLPTTYVVKTGSGGYHYYFTMPDFPIRNNANRELSKRFGPGLDIRGDGGQVVAAGSVNAHGKYIIQVNAPVAAAPAALLELLKPQSAAADQDAVVIEDLPSVIDLDAVAAAHAQNYADKTLPQIVADYRNAGPGTGNDMLFRSACSAIEIAQSPWNTYTVTQVREQLAKAAAARKAAHPRGGGQGEAEFNQVWRSARNRTVGQGRALPVNSSEGLVFDPFNPTAVDDPFSEMAALPAMETSAVESANAMIDPFSPMASLGDGPDEASSPINTPATADIAPSTERAIPSTPSVQVVEPQGDDEEPRDVILPMLPVEFYEQRLWLKELREIAYRRSTAPDAVLGGYLALTASQMPAGLRMDTSVGTPLNSSLYVVMVGPSGKGKTMGSDVAQRIFAKKIKEKGLSTGEGMIEAYWGMVKTQDPVTLKFTTEKGRTSANELFVLDEAEAFLQKATRPGDITGATLRTMWGGKFTGQQNATKERQRELEAGTYNLGMIFGTQLSVAGAMLSDAKLGTPQRFLWFSVIDPMMEVVIDDRPFDDILSHATHPDYIEIQPPSYIGGSTHFSVNPMTMTLDSEIRLEIKTAHVRKQKGYYVNEHDSQKPVSVSKVAMVLAYLDGKNHVDREIWTMANQIYDTSAAVRDAAISHADAERDQERAVEAVGKARTEMLVKRVGGQSQGIRDRIVKFMTESDKVADRKATKSDIKKYAFASKELRDEAFKKNFENTLIDMERYGQISIEQYRANSVMVTLLLDAS